MIEDAFNDVFLEINMLIKKESTLSHDQEFILDFFFGGDYEFLLTVLGLKGAASLNLCF